MPGTILLVEDDQFLREGLSEVLIREGYPVETAATAKDAAAAVSGQTPSLVVLDIGLPDGDGVELLKKWRSQGRDMPVLFLTARDEELQIVRGLDAGGNDYVTKPFRVLELLSRIRALLRRNDPDKVERSGLAIDFERMRVEKDGEIVYITPIEFKILSALVKNGGQILTRNQLLEKIWDADEQFIDDNTLSVHIRRLREKIGPERIRTIRGVGYQWEALK